MESSRESLVKKLNGHGNGVNGHAGGAAESGKPQQQPSELVDELAQAMNMGREHLARPQSTPLDAAPLDPAARSLPAMAPPSSIFDDEDDDAAMPIPSTWRTPPEPPKSGLRDQLRAAALGFATGLAVIVPVVLVMTGRLGDVPLDAIFGGGEPPTEKAASSTTTPAKSAVQVQQRTVSTMIVPPGPSQAKPEAPAITRAAVTPDTAPVTVKTAASSEPKASWTSAVAEGKKRILDGDIVGGREVLKPAVEAEEPEAIMALAETYDPNMLAAWGVRDVASDVAQAKELYERALRAGIEPAKARLAGLN